VLLIVRNDGQVFADPPGLVADARPFTQLGVEVCLPTAPPPDRVWRGAGVKRFLAGERSDAADVFERLQAVTDRFIDFDRSLGSQEVMCELTGCYILATWFLDAFHVIGYLWPNGDKGTGKTTYLHVIAELGYLGQLISASGSFAALRDLADYGASLAFDDAEDLADRRQCDPDKRTLLLAGNRRGATVPLKEPEGDGKWRVRYVNAYCPRQFSAVELPEPILASRAVVIPLVRSGDPHRAKSNPEDHAAWPCDRRRLLDDLWALALANLPLLKRYDDRAAARTELLGRDLEPWRGIFAVALWLEEEHGAQGLFGRLTALAMKYQDERSDLELSDPVRIAIKALLRHTAGQEETQETVFEPKELASWLNTIAVEDGIAEEPMGEKAFTNPRRVGWMLKRLRLEKAPKAKNSRPWKITRGAIEALARTYGMSVADEDPKPPDAKDPF
jgi:hypothetical protein